MAEEKTTKEPPHNKERLSDERMGDAAKTPDFKDLLEAFDISDLNKDIASSITSGNQNKSTTNTSQQNVSDGGLVADTMTSPSNTCESTQSDEVEAGSKQITQDTQNGVKGHDDNTEGGIRIASVHSVNSIDQNEMDQSGREHDGAPAPLIITPSGNSQGTSSQVRNGSLVELAGKNAEQADAQGSNSSTPATSMPQTECIVIEPIVVKTEKPDTTGQNTMPRLSTGKQGARFNTPPMMPCFPGQMVRMRNRGPPPAALKLVGVSSSFPRMATVGNPYVITSNPPRQLIVTPSPAPNQQPLIVAPQLSAKPNGRKRSLTGKKPEPAKKRNLTMTSVGNTKFMFDITSVGKGNNPVTNYRPIQPYTSGSQKIQQVGAPVVASNSAGFNTQSQVLTTASSKVIINITKDSASEPPLGRMVKLEEVMHLVSAKNLLPSYMSPDPPAHLLHLFGEENGVTRYACDACGDSFHFKSSLSNHRRRRNFLVTLMCRACCKTVVCYNKCMLLAHEQLHKLSKRGAQNVDISQALFKPLPDALFSTLMDVQTLPEPDEPWESIVPKLHPSFNIKFAETTTKSGPMNGTLPQAPPATNMTIGNIASSSVNQEKGNLAELPKLTNYHGNMKVSTGNAKGMEASHVLTELVSLSTEASQEITAKELYTCFECGHQIKGASKLAMHFHNIRRNSVFAYKCQTCNMYLPSVCAYRAHMRIHTEEKPFICPECGMKLECDATYFRIHVDFCCFHSSRQMVLHCERCDESCTSVENYWKHQHAAHAEVYYKCQQCPMAFKSRESYKQHMVKQHKNTADTSSRDIYKCPMCDTVFHSSEQLSKHLQSHRLPKKGKTDYMFKCKLCKFESSHILSHRYHIKHVHQQKVLEYMCMKCGSIFDNEPTLVMHTCTQPKDGAQELPKDADKAMLVEETKCPLCERTFSCRSDMLQHCDKDHCSFVQIKDISPKMKETLPENGKKEKKGGSPGKVQKEPILDGPKASESTDNDSVDVDIKEEAPVWITCPQCRHRYPTQETLDQHIKYDHVEAPSSFPCHLCTLVFEDDECLRDHVQRSHEGKDFTYSCYICAMKKIQRGFLKLSSIEKHIVLSHKMSRSQIDYSLIRGDIKDDSEIKKEATEDKSVSPGPQIKRLRLDGDHEYKCAKCDFSAASREDFSSHIKQHKMEENSLQCPDCGMCFVIKGALKRHLFMVHKVRDFKKYQSEAGIDVLTPYKEDMTRVYTNTPKPAAKLDPLECTVCYKMFGSHLLLKKHMRSHGMAFIRSKRTAGQTASQDSDSAS